MDPINATPPGVTAPGMVAAPPVPPDATMPVEVQEKYAKCLKDMQEKSEKGDREGFIKAMKEIKFYGYNDDYSEKLYDNLPELRQDESSFKANINRVAEYIEIFGSYLYPNNPEASVVPMEDIDQWTQARFALEAKSLEYYMREGAMETHARRALNEALMAGRGVMWFGFNGRKGIPQVVFDTVENLSGDPDARCLEEINWISRKRRKPRFVFKNLIGANALIDIDKDLKGTGAEGDIIEYTEFYLRVGIHHYCADKPENVSDKNMEALNEAPAEYDDSPKKYIVAEQKLVSVDTWEIPMFKLDKWPCAMLDFRLQPQKLWPVSPIQPGMGHLRAMNWLYTFYINRVRRTSRLTFVRMSHKASQIASTDVDKISGVDGSDDLGIINFELPIADADADVRKWFQAINLEHGIAEFDRMWQLVNRAFEDATGLNDLMRAGQDSNQLRTAADVQFKEQRSLTRVDDMKKQVQLWLDGIMQQLAFTARFLMTPEDIGKFFGPQAAQVWGRLGTPEEKQQEQMQRMQLMNGLMQQAIMQQQQAIMQTASAPPMMGMPPAAPPPLPTAEDIEKQIGPPQVIVLDDWINEAKRQIVAGSMRTINHDAQIDNLNFFFSSIAPLAMPVPGGAEFVAEAAKEWTTENRYTPAMQAAAKKWIATLQQQAAMQEQMAAAGMGQPGAPTEKQKPEPSQGREKAAKGQAQ